MKRAGIFLALMGVLVMVFAGVAAAAVIRGNDGPNTLVGTPNADTIYGYGGQDHIYGRGGPDRLFPGGGEDEVYGGGGNDFVNAVDRREDDISCGRGVDTAKANPGDDIEGGCEHVIREGIRVDDNDGGDD